MNDTFRNAYLRRRPRPDWQEKAARHHTLCTLALAIAAIIVGTLVDAWLLTPGRNGFGTTFALVMLAVWGARHAYFCGAADAITRLESGADEHAKA